MLQLDYESDLLPAPPPASLEFRSWYIVCPMLLTKDGRVWKGLDQLDLRVTVYPLLQAHFTVSLRREGGVAEPIR